MIEKKNLLIGGGILVGLYLLNPFNGSFRGQSAIAEVGEFNYQSARLKIINFVGRVEMTKSADNQIHIQTSHVRTDTAPNFDHIAGTLEISGAEEINSSSCYGASWFFWGDNDHDDPNISINGGSRRKLSDYPTLKIQAPDGVKLELEKNIIFGQFDDVDSLNVNMVSCGNLKFNQVKNDAYIGIRGSGDIDIKTVGGSVTSTIRGSGNIDIGSIAQDSVSQIRGSGDIHYGQINGIHKMTVTGSGDIKVDQINGDAELLVSGSGDIDIGDGDLNWLIATVRGSGDIDYDGDANNRRLKVSGSGEIDTKYDP